MKRDPSIGTEADTSEPPRQVYALRAGLGREAAAAAPAPVRLLRPGARGVSLLPWLRGGVGHRQRGDRERRYEAAMDLLRTDHFPVTVDSLEDRLTQPATELIGTERGGPERAEEGSRAAATAQAGGRAGFFQSAAVRVRGRRV